MFYSIFLYLFLKKRKIRMRLAECFYCKLPVDKTERLFHTIAYKAEQKEEWSGNGNVRTDNRGKKRKHGMNQIETTINEFYANDQRKLRQICDREMSGFGGLSPKDYDDFYSRAGYELNLAREKYDPSTGKSFFEYACGVIRFSVRKEMTDRNRAKRRVVVEKEAEDGKGNRVKRKEYIADVSIDAPIGEEDGLTIGDILPSDFDMEAWIMKAEREEYSPEMQAYLSRLSKMQINVLELTADGHSQEEIKRMLQIDSALYSDCIAAIRSYRNTRCITGLMRRG